MAGKNTEVIRVCTKTHTNKEGGVLMTSDLALNFEINDTEEERENIYMIK